MCWFFIVIKLLMLKLLLASICGLAPVSAYEYGYHPSAEEFDNLLRETHRTWTHDILKSQSERELYQNEVKSFVPKFQYESHLNNFNKIPANTNEKRHDLQHYNHDQITLQNIGSTLDFHYTHDVDANEIPIKSSSSLATHMQDKPKDTKLQLTTTQTLPEINLQPISQPELEKYSLNNLYQNNTQAHFPIYFTNPATGIVYAITEMGKSTNNQTRGNGSIPIFITKEQYERDIFMLKKQYEDNCAVLEKDKNKKHKISIPSSFSRSSTTTTTTSTTTRPQIIRLTKPLSSSASTSKLITPLKKPSPVVVRTELNVKNSKYTTSRPLRRKRKPKSKRKYKPPGHKGKNTPKPKVAAVASDGPTIVKGTRVTTKRPYSDAYKLSTQLEKPNFGSTTFSTAAANNQNLRFNKLERNRRSIADADNIENSISNHFQLHWQTKDAKQSTNPKKFLKTTQENQINFKNKSEVLKVKYNASSIATESVNNFNSKFNNKTNIEINKNISKPGKLNIIQTKNSKKDHIDLNSYKPAFNTKNKITHHFKTLNTKESDSKTTKNFVEKTFNSLKHLFQSLNERMSTETTRKRQLEKETNSNNKQLDLAELTKNYAKIPKYLVKDISKPFEVFYRNTKGNDQNFKDENSNQNSQKNTLNAQNYQTSDVAKNYAKKDKSYVKLENPLTITSNKDKLNNNQVKNNFPKAFISNYDNKLPKDYVDTTLQAVKNVVDFENDENKYEKLSHTNEIQSLNDHNNRPNLIISETTRNYDKLPKSYVKTIVKSPAQTLSFKNSENQLLMSSKINEEQNLNYKMFQTANNIKNNNGKLPNIYVENSLETPENILIYEIAAKYKSKESKTTPNYQNTNKLNTNILQTVDSMKNNDKMPNNFAKVSPQLINNFVNLENKDSTISISPLNIYQNFYENNLSNHVNLPKNFVKNTFLSSKSSEDVKRENSKHKLETNKVLSLQNQKDLTLDKYEPRFGENYKFSENSNTHNSNFKVQHLLQKHETNIENPNKSNDLMKKTYKHFNYKPIANEKIAEKVGKENIYKNNDDKSQTSFSANVNTFDRFKPENNKLTGKLDFNFENDQGNENFKLDKLFQKLKETILNSQNQVKVQSGYETEDDKPPNFIQNLLKPIDHLSQSKEDLMKVLKIKNLIKTFKSNNNPKNLRVPTKNADSSAKSSSNFIMKIINDKDFENSAENLADIIEFITSKENEFDSDNDFIPNQSNPMLDNKNKNKIHRIHRRSTVNSENSKRNKTMPKFVRKSLNATKEIATLNLTSIQTHNNFGNDTLETISKNMNHGFNDNSKKPKFSNSANHKSSELKKRKRKRKHKLNLQSNTNTLKKRKRLSSTTKSVNEINQIVTNSTNSTNTETTTPRTFKVGLNKLAGKFFENKRAKVGQDEGTYDFFEADGESEEDDDDDDDDDYEEESEEDDEYEESQDLTERPLKDDASSPEENADFGAMVEGQYNENEVIMINPTVKQPDTQTKDIPTYDNDDDYNKKRLRRRPAGKVSSNNHDYDDDDDDETSLGSNLGGFFRMIFYPVQLVLNGLVDTFAGGKDADEDPSIYTYPQYTSYHNRLKQKSGDDYAYDDEYTDYDGDSSDSSLTGWLGSLFGLNRRNKKIGSTTAAPVASHGSSPSSSWLQSWFGMGDNDDVDKADGVVHEEENAYDKWFASWFGDVKPKGRKRTTTTTSTTTQLPQVPILTIVDPLRNPQNWIGILAHHIINHTSTSTQNPLKDIWTKVTSPATTTTTTENPDIPRKLSYNKYQIWRLKPQDDSQVQALEDYKRSDNGIKLQWLKGPSLRGLTDVLVPPRMLVDFQASLTFETIDHEVLIFDVGKAIAYEKSKEDHLFTTTQKPKKHHNRYAQNKLQAMTWMRYYEFEDIVTYLENMRLRYPQLVELIHIGRSYEGRPLIVTKIESKQAAAANSANLKMYEKSKLRNKKRIGVANAVFIEAGTHGMEWIGPATATWIINELLKIMKSNKSLSEEQSLIRNTTWYIMPVLNPDGYVYSHEYDRFWKKSRSRHISRPTGLINSAMTWLQKKKAREKVCYGVDLDRNWNYQWGRRGSSKTPCNEFFAGPIAFSEPETKALSEFLMDYRTHLKLYISMQSYGQIISYPYKANTTYDTERLDDFLDVAMVGIDGLRKKGSKSRYKIDSTNDLVEHRSGCSDAFAAYDVGIPFSYTMQLADNGVHGYLLPSASIESTSRDAFEIILGMLDYI